MAINPKPKMSKPAKKSAAAMMVAKQAKKAVKRMGLSC